MPNSVEASTQPCLAPFEMLNGSDYKSVNLHIYTIRQVADDVVFVAGGPRVENR